LKTGGRGGLSRACFYGKKTESTKSHNARPGQRSGEGFFPEGGQNQDLEPREKRPRLPQALQSGSKKPWSRKSRKGGKSFFSGGGKRKSLLEPASPQESARRAEGGKMGFTLIVTEKKGKRKEVDCCEKRRQPLFPKRNH